MAALLLSLGACTSSEDDAEPPEPVVNNDLPDPSSLTDPSQIVPAGEWGVINVSYNDTIAVVALKVTDVRKGEPGELGDVTSVTGNSEQTKTGTPWWINVHWANLSGDAGSPISRIWGWDAAADEAALKLSLPESVENCSEASTGYGTGQGVEHVDCAAAMFEDRSLSVTEVLYVDQTAYPEGDHAVRFEVPAE